METKNINESNDFQQRVLDELKSIITKLTENSAKESKPQIGDWISRQQAMGFLGCKNTTIRELEKKGELNFSKIGRKIFVKKSEVEELLNRNILKTS